MKQEINEIIDIIENFHENYQEETILDFPTNFSNDTLLLIKEFKANSSSDNAPELNKVYEDFMTEVLKHNAVLKECQEFDFTSIKTIAQLIANDDILTVEPAFTHYSFADVEEIIEQMFDEMKNIKESQQELREELPFILEDYLYHIEFLEDNIQYNYYIYDGVELMEDEAAFEVAIAALKEEKLKIHDKFQQKLKSKK